MAFNQLVVKNSFTGTQTAYSAPLAAQNGSNIAMAGVAQNATASSAGLVIPVAGPNWNIEWDSLAATVQTKITTTGLIITTKWQCSNDGTNWIDFVSSNGAANVQVAATGTGSLVVTSYAQALAGVNPGFPYFRLAALNASASAITGGAGDNVIASFNFRKRWTGA
jgi:hypothetical protein